MSAVSCHKTGRYIAAKHWWFDGQGQTGQVAHWSGPGERKMGRAF